MGLINNKKILFGSFGNFNKFILIAKLRNKSVTLALASLGFIGTTSIYLSEANATPDPVFNPILQEIRNQLPRGMMMRLPSNLQVYDYQGQRISIYPEVESRNDVSGLDVVFYSQPNCKARACFRGRLTVSNGLPEFEKSLVLKPISNSTDPRQPDRVCGVVKRKVVFLNIVVKGFSIDYDFCAASRGKTNYVIWQQDGYFFVVGVGIVNTDIATSMANESPIYDSITSRQDSTYTSTSSIPKGFRHGCGTGCSISVTFTSPVREIQTTDNRSIRFASIRRDFRGAGRGGTESGSNNGYVFAECSENKLAFGESATAPSASDEWIRLSKDQKDYTTAYGYRGGYFDALCLTPVKNSSDLSLGKPIPSVPSSSTPVKSTDTIAKYPTNDDFNAFEDKLQGNPESLVKLRGNQAEQRRKFQNDWKARNPNAAKFLGAWYTGDRYFYVFPATVKGGTCVVTQDANGKLNMQVGTVLNKELRYGGGKGFFWRDRPNIIASRDSGSGSLYPIYATSAMPELPDSMIGDMERQKCITNLPFEADAQYYKERGDKFAKLGKKDEAISNYGKALELFRKQNLFAQIRTIESLIANLGGTTKPITQKPVDTVYSGKSPLYEDVKDPAYGIGNFYGLTGMTKTFRVGLNAFEVVDNGQTVNLNSKVKAKVPTIIITHGWNNDLTAPDFRNLLKAVKYNSSVQVLVVDWSQGSKTSLLDLDVAAARISPTASKVADFIQTYKLDPNNISLIGHSLGAHLSVELALELQKRGLGGVKSITLLDPAVDIPTGYIVKNLSDISSSTFIRAFYASAGGDSSFAASANESYNIKYPTGLRFPVNSHGEAMTLLANSFQGDSSRKRNCISEQFIKLDQQFPKISQNITRERPASGTKPATDLYVDYDSNKWLYPKQIVSGALDVNPEKGNCKLQSDGVRTFDSIQNILK